MIKYDILLIRLMGDNNKGGTIMRKLLLTLLPLWMLLLFVPSVSAAGTQIGCEAPRIVQTIGDPGTIQVSGSTVAVNETEEEVPVSVVLAFYAGEQTGAELVHCQVESMMLLPGTHTLSVSEEGMEGERVKCFVMNPQTMAPLGKASEAVVSEKNLAAFGLVYGYEVDEQSQLLRLSVFTSGEHVTYLAAPSVRIDGTDYASGAEVKELLETVFPSEEDVYWNDGGPGGFSMLFLTDENGQISYIDTPVQGENEADYTLRPFGIGFSNYKYNFNQGGDERLLIHDSGEKWYVNKDVSVIHVEGLRDSYMKYYSYPVEKMLTNKYDLQILTTRKQGTLKEKVNYIVAKGYPEETSYTAIHDRQMIVVSSVSRIMDEYGRETIMISGLQEGMEKDFYVDYDYYKTDLYKDVWAFGQGGIFSQYYNPSTGEYAEGITESEERKRSIFLPGDVIRVETHAVTGNVIRVTPTFLSDAKVFKADDAVTASMSRYRAFDLAVANQIDYENDTAGFTYLIDKKNSLGSNATAIVHVNKDGYVISSENSLGVTNRLYDETAGVYLFNDETGMRNDEIIDVTGFKVMVYDTSQAEHHQVYVGSTADLCDTAAEGEPASLVIMQFRSNNPRGMVILKL